MSKEHWSIVIFAARESLNILIPTLEAARSATGHSITIDLLINGTSNLSTDLVKWLSHNPSVENWNRLRVWSIPLGDKANAWSQYFHCIWADEDLVFFSDGYTRITENSIKVLGQAMLNNPGALGGSGVPSLGRTAKVLAEQLLREGGFSGGLCCIRGSVISELKRRNFHFPIGMYRSDGLMGSMLSFGLDPATQSWDAKRIQMHGDATWTTEPKHWWDFNEITSTLHRKFRQARGVLENAAVKNHFVVQKLPPELLPETVSELVLNWATRFPDEWANIKRTHPLSRLSFTHFTKEMEFPSEERLPTLRWSSGSPIL